MSSQAISTKPDNEPKFATLRRDAEASGFYTRHDQPVDFVNWSRESFWTAEEAIALFFGLEPDDVSWEALEQVVAGSAVAGDISRLRKILNRAQSKGDLQGNEYPHNYAAWANLRRIEIPTALLDAIAEYGHAIPNWDERDALQKRANAGLDERGNGAVTALKRKVSSLQKMCLGMALEKYQYRLDGKANSAATSIADALALRGLSLDRDTIRDHLAEARDANPDAVEK